MKIIEGKLIATDLHCALVVSRFNEFICERLLEGAVDTFVRHGGNKDNLTLIRVPGAFEIPLIAKKLAMSGQYQAIICLGTVIRGATSHYDHVCSGTTSGIATVSLEANIPISFGLLTTETIEQAIERAGSKAGNQGRNAMSTAIEMANILQEIEKN